MQVCGDVGGSLTLGSWKKANSVLHDCTGPQAVLLLFVCVCLALLIVQGAMLGSRQVVVPPPPQSQHTRTVLAVGMPQKGCMVHLKPCESQTSPAQQKSRVPQAGS